MAPRGHPPGTHRAPHPARPAWSREAGKAGKARLFCEQEGSVPTRCRAGSAFPAARLEQYANGPHSTPPIIASLRSPSRALPRTARLGWVGATFTHLIWKEGAADLDRGQRGPAALGRHHAGIEGIAQQRPPTPSFRGGRPRTPGKTRPSRDAAPRLAGLAASPGSARHGVVAGCATRRRGW